MRALALAENVYFKSPLQSQTEAHGPVEYFLSWSHLWRHMPVEETATQQQHTGRSMKLPFYMSLKMQRQSWTP